MPVLLKTVFDVTIQEFLWNFGVTHSKKYIKIEHIDIRNVYHYMQYILMFCFQHASFNLLTSLGLQIDYHSQFSENTLPYRKSGVYQAVCQASTRHLRIV